MPDSFEISNDIKCAINRNEPVVALESSVIANGLPQEINIRTALEIEETVKQSGAVPATIGMINGVIKVGLSKDDIKVIGDGSAKKITVRELPYAISRKYSGGFTVSATLRAAAFAGIAIMSTGGIGGIHYGYNDSLDASSDLWEMVRTNLIIVCSGPKNTLDIARTNEWLETYGVPVYGYQTDEMPAFYSRKTGISINKIDSIDEISDLLKVSSISVGIRCSSIIAVPVPEGFEIDVTSEIKQAQLDAKTNSISGKDLTPYVLKRVGELTSGKSVDSNIALLKNNAKIASEIMRKMCCDTNKKMGFLV